MTSAALHASIQEHCEATDRAEARVIANFAWQHLKAASTFRDQAAILEDQHTGEDLGAFFEDIRSYVSATIMSATAGMEALINEFFIASNCRLRPMLANFELEFWGPKGVERKQILKKYQLALKMLGAKTLAANSAVYRQAWALIELRNALVHYKPTWDPDRPAKVTFTQVLKGKYALSPFVNANGDFVTMRSMSAGCADWAVKAVMRLVQEFDSRTHLDPEKMEVIRRLET
jgi:hypothetical protein